MVLTSNFPGFQILLPPIIFYAGFSVKKKLFFQNFLTIFVFGFVGTIMAAVLIALGAAIGLQHLGMTKRRVLQTALALGAICSSSDTVSILQVGNGQMGCVRNALGVSATVLMVFMSTNECKGRLC